MALKTTALFQEDAYLKQASATVTGINDRGGIVLDQTIFYATSGGQPGDSGSFKRGEGSLIEIATTVTGESKDEIVHVPAEGAVLPQVGEELTLNIDWERRHQLMRMHTACHILSVVCPYPITGAAVNVDNSRVDFDLNETVDKAEISANMMKIVNANHPVYTDLITEAELAAQPDLVKSKNVKPPSGTGSIRLVCIGENAAIDSQPCGGTHVASTGEVGEIHIGKIEKKGRENRRMRIRFGPLPDA